MNGLQNYHNLFKQKEQLNGGDLGTDREMFEVFKSLNLSMISENGKGYVQNNSLDFGLSLFITNLGMINTSKMMSENISLNIYQGLSRLN